MPKTKNKVYARTRQEWRSWLRKNHKKEKAIWLIKYKRHTGRPFVSLRDAMDEAICFGWIDTIVKRLDDDRYAQHFVKRNGSSRWSASTLSHAKRLIKEKRMAKHGLDAYLEGLKKPLSYIKLPKNPRMPEELRAALAKNKAAEKNFRNFAPSYRRFYINWVQRAKRPETREKRIGRVAHLAGKNVKQGM